MPFLKEKSKISRSRKQENLTKKNGLRHAIFNILGDKYIGEWKDDLKAGKGTILTRHRQLYEGDVLNGYRHGFGVSVYESDEKKFIMEYRGEWRNGKMYGLGWRRYRDGGVYIGNWKNNKRQGYGLMWYPDKSFYAGDFVQDKREGLGMLVRADTSRYEGAWCDDLKHGHGIFFHLITGQKQEGVWIKDTCVHCTFVDICYRQAATGPTKYPINKIESLDAENLCKDAEVKVLGDILNSCLNLHESIFSEINQPTSS